MESCINRLPDQIHLRTRNDSGPLAPVQMIRILRVTPLLLPLLIIGCRDAPTNPGQQQFTLELREGSVPFEEATIAAGDTLRLSARLVSNTGTDQDAAAVEWSSSDSAVATVDGQGRVIGRTVGSSRIIVASGARADTGVVNVASPVNTQLECSASDALVQLGVGEVSIHTGADAARLCLRGDANDESEFLLVPFNASAVAPAALTTRVMAGPIPRPSTSLAPHRLRSPVEVDEREQRPDLAFHEHHLERSRQQFEPALLRIAGGPSVSRRSVPQVGSVMRLNGAVLTGDACENPQWRDARVMAVSRRAVLVEDTTNPSGGFTEEEYAAIGEVFDDLIWDVNVNAFGEPTDIDENERVIIFYTRAVNELTGRNSGSYVGGLFYNRDLFSRSGANSCAGSNEGEMFYMLAPDPEGKVNGNIRHKNFVLDRTFSVLAHEFQHLINDSRRLYVNRAPVWEDNWLNEGLSHIAEELAFYAASDFEPRQNLGTSPTVGAGASPFLRYNGDNVERYIRFLRDPEGSSVMGLVENLGTRGAVWAFLRYVADRDPGDDQAIWMRLTNSTTRGLDNLKQVLGEDPRGWMHDWQVSVFADDLGIEIAPEYTQPSWNFRLLIPQLPSSAGRFDLRSHALKTEGEAWRLAGGAAVFLRTRVEPGTRQLVRTTVRELPPPSQLRVAVMRLR